METLLWFNMGFVDGTGKVILQKGFHAKDVEEAYEEARQWEANLPTDAPEAYHQRFDYDRIVVVH